MKDVGTLRRDRLRRLHSRFLEAAERWDLHHVYLFCKGERLLKQLGLFSAIETMPELVDGMDAVNRRESLDAYFRRQSEHNERKTDFLNSVFLMLSAGELVLDPFPLESLRDVGEAGLHGFGYYTTTKLETPGFCHACDKFMELATEVSIDSNFENGHEGWVLSLYECFRVAKVNVDYVDNRWFDPIWIAQQGEVLRAMPLRRNVFLASAIVIEHWIDGEPPAAFRINEGDSTDLPTVITERQTDSPPRLSAREQEIIDLIRDAQRRMVTTEVLAKLEANNGAAAESTTKSTLSTLVRRGLLTNRQDVVPKGYGLAEWD